MPNREHIHYALSLRDLVQEIDDLKRYIDIHDSGGSHQILIKLNIIIYVYKTGPKFFGILDERIKLYHFNYFNIHFLYFC